MNWSGLNYLSLEFFGLLTCLICLIISVPLLVMYLKSDEEDETNRNSYLILFFSLLFSVSLFITYIIFPSSTFFQRISNYGAEGKITSIQKINEEKSSIKIDSTDEKILISNDFASNLEIDSEITLDCTFSDNSNLESYNCSEA